MTNVIWKYECQPGRFTLDLPIGAEVLSVAAQHNTVQLWATVNPEHPTEPRLFESVCTGGPAPYGWRFLGTALLMGGLLVFHIFEAPRHD